MSDRAVVNLDDERWPRSGWLGSADDHVRARARVGCASHGRESTAEGIRLPRRRGPIRSALRGSFNVENALAAFATARWLGIEDGAAADDRVGRVVPGRVETVEAGQGFLVMVDYAHTPDGVENVLRAARSLTDGRLIGCSGPAAIGTASSDH